MTRNDMLTSTAGQSIARFWTDESGATAIEYAMIASGVGATIAATVYVLGGKVGALFTSVSNLFS